MEDLAKEVLSHISTRAKEVVLLSRRYEVEPEADFLRQRRVRRDPHMRVYHLEEGYSVFDIDDNVAIHDWRVLATFDCAETAVCVLARDRNVRVRRLCLHVDGRYLCGFGVDEGDLAARALRRVMMG